MEVSESDTSDSHSSETIVNHYIQPGEKLIYSEDAQPFENISSSVFWVLFFITSSPFFAMIAIEVIGALSQGRTLTRIDHVASEFGIILVELVVLSLGVPHLCRRFAHMFPQDQKLVITNKRIFYTGIRSKLLATSTPLLETNFCDTLFVATETLGKQEYIKIKSRNPNPQEDEPLEKLLRYNVSNSKLIYSYLPSELTLSKGELSIDGSKEVEREKKTTFVAQIFLLVFVLAFAGIIGCVYLQETTSTHLKEGKRALRHQHNEKAEVEFKKAYDGISLIPFHSYYGPACYRLASAYLQNNKPELAIPLFQKAIANCNHQDSDSGVTWKPAIFRSYAKLGAAYESKSDTTNAVANYEKALGSMDLETETLQVLKVCKDYSELLQRTGDAKKATTVNRIAARFVPQETRYKAFSE